jgi:transposase
MDVDNAQPPAPRKRKYHTHSDDMRACVVHMRARGASWQQIEDTTSVAQRTAQDWVRRYDTEERLTKRHCGGAHHVVHSADTRTAVVSAQESDAVLRLADVQSAVQQSRSVVVPLRTISDMLLKDGFTTKKVQQYANARNTLKTKQQRAAWCRDIGSTLSAETAIFIDESSFSFNIMRTRGRSRRGEPAIGVVPAIRGNNHTVIAAISPTRGLIYYEIKITEPDTEFIRKRSNKKKKTGPKGVSRDIFRTFLCNLFATPTFRDASSPFTILFDNARIHLGDIDETIFQAGHIQQRLAAWSPELNPIEYAFSTWKFAYRVHYPATDSEIDAAIRESSFSITPLKCQHYFEHCQSLYPHAIAMEDI